MRRLAILCATVMLAACQPQPAVGARAVAGDITVERAIAHPPLGGQTTGVAYMVIRNSGAADDRLTSATSPAASPVELHTHIKAGDVMRMERVDAIDVPAGGEVVLAPRGLHLMLFSFSPADGSAPLTLTFEKAGAVTVDVPVVPR